MHEREITLAEIEKQNILDHCAVVALYLVIPREGIFLTGVAGLEEINTRGQNGAGAVGVSADGKLISYKGKGNVSDVFTKDTMKPFNETYLKTIILQARYGTNGNGDIENVQPLVRRHKISEEIFSVAHNGQFSDSQTNGTESDTVRFADELAITSGNSWDERILHLQNSKTGAWSLVINTPEGMYVLRDFDGIRPLSYGSKMDPLTGSTIWIVASETSALKTMGISDFIEVMPGAVLKITDAGVSTLQEGKTNGSGAACMFENVYTQSGRTVIHRIRTDERAINFEKRVTEFRRQCGIILAREHPITELSVDFAIGVPGTGITGGQSFAEALGIPYIQAITDRQPQTQDTRTFMTEDIRTIPDKIREHFYFTKQYLSGKRVVLIDDSIVRGNITKNLIQLLREDYEVSEVHVRVLCPPIDKGCHLGINTKDNSELLAYRNNNNIEQMRMEIGADTLCYLSDEGLFEAAGTQEGFCLGCMVGHCAPLDRKGRRNSH